MKTSEKLQEIRYRLSDQATYMEHVLYSDEAMSIVQHTSGMKFNRLLAQRRIVRGRVNKLWEICGMLYKEEREAEREENK